MHASKVTFSRETRMALTARPLSRGQKSKLRQQRVLEFIREQVNNEAQARDLIYAAGYDASKEDEYGRGWAFISGLVRRGVLIKEDGSDPKNSYVKRWTIPGDVKTRVINDNGKMQVPPQDGEISIKTDGAEHAAPRPAIVKVAEDSAAKIVLDYAHIVSKAAETLRGYTKDEELLAYRSGLLKAVELLQDARDAS